MNEAKQMLNELMRVLLFLPEQASSFALRLDRLHYFVFVVTMVASGIVGLGTVYLMFRYRQRKEQASTPIVHPSGRFELVIVGVPLMFFLVWVFIGYRDYIWYTTPPKNAMDVYVTAKKWMWHFAYPDGPNANAVLHVPANRPVRLLLTSRDVIHSFYVPEFRVKQDAVPGRYTQLWFQATKTGRYRVYCTEFCGTWHSQMLAEVVVMPGPDFDAWMQRMRLGLAARADTSGSGETAEGLRGDLATYGRRVAATHGCFKCHTVDGEPHIGPTWVDLYRRKTVLVDGRAVIADEAYLTESMMDPYTKVVKGYAQVMPTFRGKLAAPEAAALVEFIKSLRGSNLENMPAKEAAYGPLQQRP